MNAQDFCYWLQGYSELTGERPTEEQWAAIREHLKLVFTKVTQERNDLDLVSRKTIPAEPFPMPTIICSRDRMTYCANPDNADFLDVFKRLRSVGSEDLTEGGGKING